MAERDLESTVRKQHAVPQHILGVEFRLVGSLTVRQFLWVAGGLVLAYLLFGSRLPVVFRYPLAGISALLGLAVAFLPAQDQRLEVWLRNFIAAIFSPTQRIWIKSDSLPELFLVEYGRPLVKTEVVPVKDRARLEEYLKTLARKEVKPAVGELDVKEREFLEKWGFGKVFASAPAVPLAVPYKPSFGERGRRVVPTSTLASEINYALQPVISVPEGGKARLISSIRNVRPGRKLHTLPKFAPEAPPVRGELVVGAKGKGKPRLPPPPPKVSAERREQEIKEQLERIARRVKELGQKRPKPPQPVTPPAAPSTPPAAGEKKIEMAARQEKFKEERERWEEVNLGSRSKISQLTEQNSQLTEQIRKIQKEVEEFRAYTSEVTAKNDIYNRRLKEQESRLEALAKEKEATEMEMRRLQRKVAEAQSQAAGPLAERRRSVEERIEGPKPPPETNLPPLVKDIPNVINGFVKDSRGRLLEGVVVIVKDDQNEPVRALRTNKLGQFVITTPLPNGRYTVEVTKAGLKFDIITVDILGNVLAPIEFRASGLRTNE